LIASCTDLNVDSGSNLKFRLLLLPKMQTPVGVNSGTPALWSSLEWVKRWRRANW